MITILWVVIISLTVGIGILSFMLKRAWGIIWVFNAQLELQEKQLKIKSKVIQSIYISKANINKQL